MLPGQDEWLNAGTILMMAGKTSLKIQNFALMHEGGQRRVGPWKEPQSPRKRWQTKMGMPSSAMESDMHTMAWLNEHEHTCSISSASILTMI